MLLLLPGAAEPVVMARGGYSHSIFLKETGNVFGVGHNMYGQLADKTTLRRMLPVRVMSGVQSIATGYYHSLFLMENRTVMAAGDNEGGQLGDGTTDDAESPVEVMRDVKSMAAGASHSLFLKTDGIVHAVGYNAFGQLADGTTHDHHHPVQVRDLETVEVMALAAGTLHSLFLSEDGKVFAAGNNENGQLGSGDEAASMRRPVEATLHGKVQAIAAGGYHSLFLMQDGTIYTAGANKCGQLADGTRTDRFTPVRAQSLPSISSIAAGFQHSLFLATNGKVWSAGDNAHGQLADGTNRERVYPARLEHIDKVVDVAAGALHSIFVMETGTITEAGSNFWCQLADGTCEDQSTPVNALVPWELTADEVDWIVSLQRRFNEFRWSSASANLMFCSAVGAGTAVVALLVLVSAAFRTLRTVRPSLVAPLGSEGLPLASLSPLAHNE